MKDYLVKDNWKIIEDQYHPESNTISEGVFSIGNGQVQQRANFEETFTGKTIQGNSILGANYHDRPNAKWWKEGEPEYIAAVPNACNWIGIRILLDQEEVNIATAEIKSFYRELDLRSGLLTRKVEFVTAKGRHLSIETQRFCSMADHEICAIEYKVKSHNYSGGLALVSFLDFDVTNNDINYNKKFWEADRQIANKEEIYVIAKNGQANLLCAASMDQKLTIKGEKTEYFLDYGSEDKYAEVFIGGEIIPDGEWIYEKYVNISSTLNSNHGNLQMNAVAKSKKAKQQGFSSLMDDHIAAWAKIWKAENIVLNSDDTIQIDDIYNIFQLHQSERTKS